MSIGRTYSKTHGARVARVAVIGAVALLGLLATGCRQDMHNQPKIQSLEANAFFADGQGARPIPTGTVARGQLQEDTAYYQGKDENGQYLTALPAQVELTEELLYRGKERFEIFCTPCHDRSGSGRGMIVRRGFNQPKPLYEQRLLDMPLGYFYENITQGFGVMSSYARQVPVADRWAIVAYVRALQLSQSARLDALPSELQDEFHQALEEAQHAAEAHGNGDHGNDHNSGH